MQAINDFNPMDSNPINAIKTRIFAYIEATTDPSDFRTYLTNLDGSERVILLGSGNSASLIANRIVRSAPLLTIYLEFGFGLAHWKMMLQAILYVDNLDSLKVLIEDPRIKRRIVTCDEDRGIGSFWGEHITTLVKGKCLLYLIERDDVIIDVDKILSLAQYHSNDAILMILRHPRYAHLIYELPIPSIWNINRSVALYGSTTVTNDTRYKELDALLKVERIRRTQQNIRALFWLTVLAIRMRQFTERYWSPGNKKSIELAEEFNRKYIE